MNNIKTMTSEYRVACESGIVAGTRVEMASERCEGVFAYGNTRSEHGFVPFSEGNGLLLKTGNNLGAFSGRMRRSDWVWGLAGSGFGTNLVQIEFAERPVALGCVGLLFASADEFGCSAGNSVLAAA